MNSFFYICIFCTIRHSLIFFIGTQKIKQFWLQLLFSLSKESEYWFFQMEHISELNTRYQVKRKLDGQLGLIIKQMKLVILIVHFSRGNVILSKQIRCCEMQLRIPFFYSCSPSYTMHTYQTFHLLLLNLH